MTSKDFKYDQDRRLYLSQKPAGPREHGVMRQLNGWQEVRPGDKTSIGRIKALAGQLSCESVIYLASMVNLFLSTIHGIAEVERRKQQIALVRELFPAELSDELVARLSDGRADIVLFEEQMLLAAALAIRYGKPGPRSAWSKRLGGEFLLRVTDCLAGASGTEDEILAIILRRLGASTNEQDRYLLARYFDLLVTRARTKSGYPSPIDLAFEANAGMSVETYLALGFAYSSLFTAIRDVADLTTAGFDTIISRIESQLADAPEARVMRNSLIGDLAWFESTLPPLDRLGELPTTTYVAFYERPFIRLSNGSAIPISVRLALQRLSLGVFWTAFTGAQRKSSGVVDLNAYFGQLFQDYVTDALSATYRDHQHARFVAERDIATTDGRLARPDAVIAEGETWIALEVTISALKMQTVLKGDVPGFRTELRDDKFARKFAQPVIAIEHILAERLTLPDLDPLSVTDFYPVLLLLHPFPQFFNTWSEIDAVYQPPQTITLPTGRHVRVHRLQMLDAEELEMLEAGIRAGATLSSVLAMKETGDPGRLLSMKNFVLNNVAREPDNPRMKGLFDAMHDAIKPELAKFFGNPSGTPDA